MRFSWIRARGAVVVSAAMMALHGAPVLAQFVPYTPGATQGQSYNQYQAHTAQPPYQAQPYQASQQYQAQVPTPGGYGQQAKQPQYTAMAYQAGGNLSHPVESVSGMPVQSAPVQQYSAAPAAGCNCQSSAPAMNYSQPAPAPASFESYQYGGCTAGACSTYNTFDSGCGIGPYGGCASGCDSGCGNGCLGGCYQGCGRRWFGGFYGLFMERDGNPWRTLAFSTSEANGPGYYPTDTEFVVNLNDIDNDTFAGAEFRFGSTLGSGGCGCGPRLGWEAAYWGLVEDTSTFVYTDTTGDGNRLYSMIDYRGLEYSPTGLAADYRPVNHYYDYGPPTSDYTVGPLDELQVRSITARNSFSMQNVEINLLRLPICGGGYYASGIDCGCGGCAGSGLSGRGRLLGRRGGMGGCDTGCCTTGGCDSCAGGSCGLGGGGCCGSRYAVTGIVGFRYIRMDEDFMFRTDYENITSGGTGFMAHNVDVDSHLFGAQFGCNAIYRCGCSGRWAFHCNTVFGVFNNHMEVWNRFDVPVGGTARYANGTNADFDLRYEDDDIALLGELRAGASYQYSCNWRLFGGYRLFGLSGAALAFDQLTSQFITPSHTSYVDSDGSIIMHGLQGGIECTY